MPFDLANIAPQKPVKGRHIADLYTSLTGGMPDQPITLATLSVNGTLTVNGVTMALIPQSAWDALVARVTALEAASGKDPILRSYVQGIMGTLDPGGVPTP